MKKEDKVSVVQDLVELLRLYKNFYLTDVEALAANKTSELRRTCFKNNVKLVVVKNKLLQIALKEVDDSQYSPLFDYLKGSTAVMFSDIANAPAKIIKEAAKGSKEDSRPKLKAAYVEESLYLGAENLESLVNIKSKDELVAEVVALLQSPIKNVLSSLQSSGTTIHGVLKTLEEKR